MKKPIYSIQELEQYLLQKKKGYTDPIITQQIQKDDFLQTVIIGLEKQLAENKTGNITTILSGKKQTIWSALAPALATSNTTSTPSTTRFSQGINEYLNSWNYDFRLLRIHLLLGFNCSAIVILLFVACWLNVVEESPTLVSTLDELTGYKP